MENEPKTAVSAKDVEQAIVTYGHDAGEFNNGVFYPNGLVQGLMIQLNETDLQEAQP